MSGKKKQEKNGEAKKGVVEKKKSNAGRPVKMDDNTVKKLEEVFAMDGSVEEACFYANITRQTYYNWINENPELFDRFEALRQKPILKARNSIIRNLDDPNFALKYLEKKKKDEFGSGGDAYVVNQQNNSVIFNEKTEQIIQDLGLTEEDFNDENIERTTKRITDYLRGE